MASAQIIVHPPLATGSRRGTARGQVLGLVHSNQDVVEFLRRAGLEDAERLLYDPSWGGEVTRLARSPLRGGVAELLTRPVEIQFRSRLELIQAGIYVSRLSWKAARKVGHGREVPHG